MSVPYKWRPSAEDLEWRDTLNATRARRGQPPIQAPIGVEHRDGIPWADKRVHLNGWRGRWPFHRRHAAQTRGDQWVEVVERCRCGAIREADDRFWTRP